MQDPTMEEHMQTRAAILRQINTPREIVTLETESPRQDEVIVEMAACGL
jgi:Zn-dependent alcohol dehydrogenase